MFDAAVSKLRAAGAVLEELELPEIDQANWDAINTILASEGAQIFAAIWSSAIPIAPATTEVAGREPERRCPQPTTSPPGRVQDNWRAPLLRRYPATMRC